MKNDFVIDVHHLSKSFAGKLAVNNIALQIKKGDKVLFGKWSGTEVEVDNTKVMIMKESDVMAILK